MCVFLFYFITELKHEYIFLKIEKFSINLLQKKIYLYAQ